MTRLSREEIQNMECMGNERKLYKNDGNVVDGFVKAYVVRRRGGGGGRG